MTRVWRRLARAYHEAKGDARVHYQGFLSLAEGLQRRGLIEMDQLRVLDIGCGDRAPVALLFAAHGAEVSAIDLLPVRLGGRRPLMPILMLFESGPAAAMRLLVRDLAHTYFYWRELSLLAGRDLPFSAVDLYEMDAEKLLFTDESFDVVVSSAVWEHIRDVRAATREVNRVLRPGGRAVIQAAHFPSLGGGHHAEWHSLDPNNARTVRPWDHVRAGALPLPLFCNRWRAEQFREVFESELNLQDWELGKPEGHAFLTDELRAELGDYDDQELLVSSATAWALKADRSSPA